MSREAFGDPPDVDDREPCDADRPTEIWGVAALAPKQKAAFEKHCTGDCGKISMGGLIDDEVTGGMFVCCQPTCPYEAKAWTCATHFLLESDADVFMEQILFDKSDDAFNARLVESFAAEYDDGSLDDGN